ncbi:MAG: MarR family transcriptional regulator [Candidatus Thalassarchaeum sp.]|nr:MarR family transcriptional regulator [Candidatus Thalassarchaeum sp.]MDP6920879.1 MarR family transcriptional regulator [Candidatus Thalassarchaeum sp.]
MSRASARTSRVFPMAFLMFAVLVVSAPAAAADQEATWVRTTPGVWMLEDSDGLLHEPQPQAGLFLSPVEGRTIGVALAGALEGTWLIEDIWSTGLGSQNNEESGQEMEQGITPISIPALPWAPAFMAMILLSLALVSAGDEPTRAKMVRSMGRFSQLRVTEGTGTLAGTYQRGRLEGFLTAHPGCHLSGIIRALEMGNHQAVHHLRILENEGNVWCRRDGRLLRYYTSAVDRAAETSNLPRPVDASQLSDVALMVLRSIAEQEDGETPPTQRELASTIGTSQQLVGHHLKRLESQGLITRRRRGLRTNRELTDEGMRLWATLVEPLSLRP